MIQPGRERKIPQATKGAKTRQKNPTENTSNSAPSGEAVQPPDDVVTLDALLRGCGEPVVKVLALANITKTVWYIRMKHPEWFTIEEVESLSRTLNKIARLYERPTDITPQVVFEAIRNTIATTQAKKAE